LSLTQRLDKMGRFEIGSKDLSYQIIGLAMEVHRKLGYGFLEKVYENSLMILFRREGIRSEQELLSNVVYGEFRRRSFSLQLH